MTAKPGACCLVIGGLGFLGSRVAASLADAGYAVRVFDRARQGSSELVSEAWGGEFVAGDLADRDQLRRATEGVDYVFHCAYATVPRTAAADPARDLSANVLVLLQLLDLLRDEGVSRLVYLSSGGTVYGPSELPLLSETHPTNPISAYGISKLASEKYIGLYQLRYGLDATILRLSNPYGPGQNVAAPQGVVGHFLKRIADGGNIEVWGDGEIVRDYFFADDLQLLIPRLLSQPSTSGVFNIGSGQGHSLNDVIHTIREVVDVDVSVEYLPAQPYDAPRNVLDVSKARETLGWSCSTSFADGVAATWERIVSGRKEQR